MHLLIGNYGVKLEVEADRFKISDAEEIRYASALKLSSICFLKPGTATTAALELAAENEIPVIIINETGDVTAWLWSHRYGTIADIRVNQAFFSRSVAAVQWMQQLMQRKLQEQAGVLQWLGTRITAHQLLLTENGQFIAKQSNELGKAHTMEAIMATEAIASLHYWGTITTAMQKYVHIPGREKRGTNDPFNICLNYLYGFLYGQIEQSLLMAGADPYMGFMHINRHARPALAFDHIEPFRPWVDRLVIQLFMKPNELLPYLVPDEATGKLRIDSSGKKILLSTYFQFMEQRSYLAGKRIKNKDHIHFLSRELVQTLKKFNPDDTTTHYI